MIQVTIKADGTKEISEVSDINSPNLDFQIAYNYNELVEFKIRLRYSISDESSLVRRKLAGDTTVNSQFDEYHVYCEQCKAEAKVELGI